MHPATSSENEKGEVHCRHTPSCTKWVHRRTRNRHWQDLLRKEAQGKCMRCVRRAPTAHSWSFFSVVHANDADNESSGSEDACSSTESAVELSSSRSPSPQRPPNTSKTPPLDFPGSPAPHQAVSDNGFNMDGYDQQSDYISGWYTTEQEVRSSPFNVLD